MPEAFTILVKKTDEDAAEEKIGAGCSLSDKNTDLSAAPAEATHTCGGISGLKLTVLPGRLNPPQQGRVWTRVGRTIRSSVL